MIVQGPELRIQGFFRMVVERPDGSVKKDTGWFPNVITNAGLDRIGSQTSPLGSNGYAGENCVSYVMVGTGNAVPAVTDTQLQAQTAYTNTSFGSDQTTLYGPTPYYAERTFARRFGQGAVVGNMREVGAGWDTTNVFSRCLIKDGGGNPTDLVLESIDILTVYYKLRMYPKTTDSTYDFVVSGTTHSATTRIGGMTYADGLPKDTTFGINARLTAGTRVGLETYSGWKGRTHPAGTSLVSITDANVIPNAGTNLGYDTFTKTTYVPGSYYAEFVMTFTVDQANHAGGLGGLSVLMAGMGVWQTVWTPAIAKDNTKTLSLTFRISWNRYP